MILETYDKQPYDDKDYDVDYTDWLVSGDEVASATATVECTTTPADEELEAYQVDTSGSGVKVWVRGGTDGESYKVTIRTETSNNPARKDECELVFNVKNT